MYAEEEMRRTDVFAVPRLLIHHCAHSYICVHKEEKKKKNSLSSLYSCRTRIYMRNNRSGTVCRFLIDLKVQLNVRE